jgi:hypothetical protein
MYSPPTASWDYGIPELVSCDIESVLVRESPGILPVPLCQFVVQRSTVSMSSWVPFVGRVSVWGCLLEGCPSKMRRTERRMAMKRATIQREKNQLAGRRRDSSSEGQICERLRRWHGSAPAGHIPPAIEKGSGVPTLTRSKQRRKSSLPQRRERPDLFFVVFDPNPMSTRGTVERECGSLRKDSRGFW